MGRGQRSSAESTPTTVVALRASRGAERERPYAGWEQQRLERELYTTSDREFAGELERELWRRPRGSGFSRGQDVRGMTVSAIDCDRLRLIVELPTGGRKSVTLNQMLTLMSDGRVPVPVKPDRRAPAEPVDYGQYADAPARPHPSHVPHPDFPERSAPLAAERARIDAQRDHMSEIRMDTDIVAFERLYWEQHRDHHALALAVQAAGGLDPQTGSWGVRYVTATPEIAAAQERLHRARYEHIQGLRDAGAGDQAIIAYLEAQYSGPFAGPRAA